MKRIGFAIAAVPIVLVAAFIFWPDNQRARSVAHERYGQTSVGEKFGVRVGMPWRQADHILRAQFGPKYVLWEPFGAQTPILVGPAEVSYRDTTGVITLKLSNGEVQTIQWHYPGRFYIDL